MSNEKTKVKSSLKLPKSKVKASRVNPKSIVIFSHPKSGKTTAVSGLDNCLILDIEKGSEYVDALKIDIIEEARKDKVLPIVKLLQYIDTIKKANIENKGYIYKYIALDTISALEDIAKPYAKKMYQSTPMGRNWVGDDITTLPNGAGWLWLRNAVLDIKDKLLEICDTLILLGHVKDSSIRLGAEEITERGLKLSGQLSSIVCSKVDAVGYLYRKENKTLINFKASESLIVTGRSKHLRNKVVTVVESEVDEDENVTNLKIDWSEIFI